MTPATIPPMAADPQPETLLEDEDDSWVPLEAPSTASPEDHQPVEEVVTPGIASAEISAATALVTRPHSEATSTTTNSRTTSARPTGCDSVQVLQRRVEMRRHLQQRLVHHPIHLLWSHFLWHLSQEFWNLNVQIRVAIGFLLVGALSKICCIMTWYVWYPRTILLSCVMLGSWVYLNHNDIPRRIQGVVDAIVHLPNRIPETLEHLDPKQTRILCVVLFFLPTLLQIRTISFLADLNATGGDFLWNLLITLLMVATSAFYLTPTRVKAARDISQICMLVLYGSALWITLRQWDIMTMPSLAAPFFLSTGTLLLAYDDHDNMEWFSRVVRYSLRLTLRDILATVGTSVQEDEMLQLAMLRWIVDYWSYTPQGQQQQQQSSSSTNQSSSHPATTNPSPTTAPSTAHTPPQGLEWNELLPMLNMATDQMTSEVHSLQHPHPSQAASQPSQSASQPSASSSTPPSGTTAGNIPTSGSSNTGGNNNNNNASASPADDPLQNLHTMLASMNVDDRARPAVAAYKRNVEEFPPSRDLALVVSIVRRCPACLTFLWHLLVASMFQPLATTFCVFLMLLPLMGLEVLRIRAWALACEALSRLLGDAPDESSTEGSTTGPTTSRVTAVVPFIKVLSQVDPMTILLSGDDDTIVSQVRTDTSEGVTSITAQMTVPSLLIVWRNVQSSVKALEVSLTAARCVQTGAVAMEFAKNVMSLAQFGSEVSRHGWMHGLTVIAKEVVFNHHGDVRSSPAGSSATFTQAAVSAVHNGQVVARNLQVLATEDENVGHIVSPIVGLFGFVGGLFQRGENNQDQTEQEANQTEDKKHDDRCSNADSPTETEKRADKPDGPTQEDDEIAKAAVNIEHCILERKTSEGETGQDQWDDLQQQEQREKPSQTVVADVKVAVRHDGDPSAGLAAASGVRTEPNAKIPMHETADAAKAVAGDNDANPETETTASKSFPITVNPDGKSKDDGNKNTVIGTESGGDSRADLALVMELVADAFELNLINETEKNEFCLKLSEDSIDKDLVSGMKRTLQGLILETSQEHYEPIVSTTVSPGQATNSNTNTSRAPAKETPTSDAGWSPILDAVASKEQVAIQPLDYSERLADAVRTREELSMPQLSEREGVVAATTTDGDGIPTVASSAPNRRRDNDDNMWVKVGGGIAMIGAAVVGGAFLAMKQDNPNNNENANNTTGGNQSNRSSVTIERVDDNEDQNEWESMGRDANSQAQ